MRNAVAAARLDEEPQESAGRHRFLFKSDAPVFAGHFPGEPILPGVFQVEMARQSAEVELKRSMTITRIVKAKFSRVIRPDEVVEVVIKCKDGETGTSATVTFAVGGEEAGKCVLELATRQ